jgi:AraC-like DNA-binding protein
VPTKGRPGLPQNHILLGARRTLFQGELPATDWHAHGAPVLLLGLSGRFEVRLRDGAVLSCHSALIDAGHEHIFDARGERIASLYLEPDSAQVRYLRRAFLSTTPMAIDIAEPSRQRRCTDRRLSDFDLGALLNLDRYPKITGNPDSNADPVDARIAASLRTLRTLRTIGTLRTPDDTPVSRTRLATSAGLSPSRFNHLFSEEMGVCFRRYRLWVQLRAALSQWPADRQLTTAALAAGFTDSSHFCRVFRSMIGLAPSTVFRTLAALEQDDESAAALHDESPQ